MKRILIFAMLLALGTTVFAGIPKSGKKRMTLKGEYRSATDGEKIYLQGKGSVYVDSAVVNNGKFEFPLKNIEPMEYAIIRFNRDGEKEHMLIYLDYYDTYLTLKDGTRKAGVFQLINATVSGNPTHDAVMGINDRMFSGDQDPSEFMTEFITVAERGDLASAYVLWKYPQQYYERLDWETVKGLVDNLSEYVKKTTFGKEVIADYVQFLSFMIGAKVPDLTMKTPDGKLVTLSEFIRGKKLVMLYIWSSWSEFSRKENPGIKAMYTDYKDKGLDILGISFDSDHEQWVKAIEEDGLTWTHVSNLAARGWDEEIKKKYNVFSIPYVILIDEKGYIVARGLHWDALCEKVAEYCR